jgi:2-methylcitrate dehydratase
MFPIDQSTILGTSQRTTIDMAAFANATAGRYAELNDTLHIPGKPGGHPSDAILPLLTVGESVGAGGNDLVTAVVLAYEIYISMADATNLPGWDATNWLGLGTAVGAGKLMEFDAQQFRDCISLAIIPNNALRRARRGHLTMWKAAAAGQAARAGVFAALLTREGMEGPTLPFEGETGWLENVGNGKVELGPFGGGAVPFRLHRTIFKPRSACGTSISSILAAEKAHQANRDVANIDRVLVETYGDAKKKLGTRPHHWNPMTRESADHSIPYVVAAALVDGQVGPAQFDEAHLHNPLIRRVIATVDVVEDPEFTKAYSDPPHLHRTRVTVFARDGSVVVGESGGDHGEIGIELTDSEVEEKFRTMTDGHLSLTRQQSLLDALWNLETLGDVRDLPGLMISESAGNGDAASAP